MKSRSLVYTSLVLFAFLLPADQQGFAAFETGRAQLDAARDISFEAAARPDAGAFFSAFGDAVQILHSAKYMAFRPYGSATHDARAYEAGIPEPMADIVAKAAAAHGVDPRLVAAVATHESRWDTTLVSDAGASGVMQLMPYTARVLGVSDVFDERENIAAGTRYLRKMLDRYHGNLDLALAAYNAGPRAVARYKGVPPFPETRAYIVNVKATYAALKAQSE